jgi:DNA invertase Pin-like site-specific DNA recombinase
LTQFNLNYNIETLTPEKQINPMSQFLITILAEVARMERKTIRERIASGYENYRKE